METLSIIKEWTQKIKQLKESAVSERAGTSHEETILADRAFCNVCGWVDLVDVNQTTIKYHADSVIPENLN